MQATSAGGPTLTDAVAGVKGLPTLSAVEGSRVRFHALGAACPASATRSEARWADARLQCQIDPGGPAPTAIHGAANRGVHLAVHGEADAARGHGSPWAAIRSASSSRSGKYASSTLSCPVTTSETRGQRRDHSSSGFAKWRPRLSSVRWRTLLPSRSVQTSRVGYRTGPGPGRDACRQFGAGAASVQGDAPDTGSPTRRHAGLRRGSGSGGLGLASMSEDLWTRRIRSGVEAVSVDRVSAPRAGAGGCPAVYCVVGVNPAGRSRSAYSTLNPSRRAAAERRSSLLTRSSRSGSSSAAVSAAANCNASAAPSG